jgi:hypothetical protein
MTLQRKYPGASNFSNWLRVQPGISSELGFVATDIDYIWSNYKTGYWMLIVRINYFILLTKLLKQIRIIEGCI